MERAASHAETRSSGIRPVSRTACATPAASSRSKTCSAAPSRHGLAAGLHPVAEGAEGLRQEIGGGGAGRRTEALVAALMLKEGIEDGIVVRVRRLPGVVAVIGQGRVEGRPFVGDGAGQTADPRMGGEIEQGCRRDEVGRAVQRRLRRGGKIGLGEGHLQVAAADDQPEIVALAFGAIRPGGEPAARGGEQSRVMVDQPPSLPPRQVRGDRAEVRAGAAAEIDDGDALAAGEDRPEFGEKAGMARAVVGRLPQQPANPG